LLERVASARLRHVFALHISENNNLPRLATAELERCLSRLGRRVPVTAVAQHVPTPFSFSQRAPAQVVAGAGQIELL
jgi:hypothetical protein